MGMCAHVIVMNVLNMLNVLDVLNVGVHLRITKHEESVVLWRRDGPGKQRSCLSHAFAVATVHQSMNMYRVGVVERFIWSQANSGAVCHTPHLTALCRSTEPEGN